MNAYKKPELVQYGRIDQLTLGTSGTMSDFIWLGGGMVTPDTTNPTCTTSDNFGCIQVFS